MGKKQFTEERIAFARRQAEPGTSVAEVVRVAEGRELCSRSLDLWGSFNGVKLDFSGPGKPSDDR